MTDAELVEGARRLVRKVRRYRPAFVAFLGISAYRTAFGQQDVRLGQVRNQFKRPIDPANGLIGTIVGNQQFGSFEQVIRLAGFRSH